MCGKKLRGPRRGSVFALYSILRAAAFVFGSRGDIGPVAWSAGIKLSPELQAEFDRWTGPEG